MANACAPVPTPSGWHVAGGDPEQGEKLIGKYGCGSCHLIPGLNNAQGNVGPPLMHFGERVYIAGVLRNTPEQLMHWLRDPQAVVPGNAMPNMDVSERDARDLAAFLYTLR